MTSDSMIALLKPALWETVQMVAISTVLSCLLGLVLGVVLILTGPTGVRPNAVIYRVLGAIVNVGRSVPYIVLMIAVIPLTRMIVGTSIGTSAAMVPLVIAAVPYVARLVESAMQEVPAGNVEAVLAMGGTPLQLVRHVYLREAAPALVRATTLTAISLISYSAMAGAVGGGGLGDLAVRYGYHRFRTDVMLATVVVLVVLVQLVQFAGDRIARRVDHR